MIIDHIGIAVRSLEEGSQFYKSLGFKEMAIEEVLSENVRVGLFECENNSRIELLEPLNDSSAIHKFLQKRGPGIHHICLQVEDIGKSLSQLKKAGVKLINEEPIEGAHNCMVAFVHPKSTGGVLIELSQPKEG